MATHPERIILTYDDLIQMPEDGCRYELYEGELEVSAAPIPRHQAALLNLASTLLVYCRDHDLGTVLTAPTDVLLSNITVVEPDILFVAKDRESIIGDRYISGPPDLVVEVLSPSTASRDRHTKRQLYARHGVPHYWTFDPNLQIAEASDLVDGAYHVSVHATGSESFSAEPFPELSVSLAAIWPK
jgi:Uma2 family endonuclease